MAQEKVFQLADKVVKLLGHQDEDYFRVFTESLETRSDLSAQEKETIREKIRKDPSMILD
jgi:hypothetical protein